MAEKSPEFAERLKQQFKGPLPADQRYLLGEMKSVIDFALKNDLSMKLVNAVIGHDLEEFSRRGGLGHFSPKSEGFSSLE